MATMLEVMESRLGIQEIPGKAHNKIIVGWAAQIGHGEVTDDETSWCSICACSAAMDAGLPIPPHNIRLLARSWLTWGVSAGGDVRVGDVAVWPRKEKWQGHVNVVKDVRTYRGKLQVRCIGGNQGGLKGGDAVTLTDWIDAKGALDFRRAVPATVPDLRKAGSTEIKKADQIQNGGWLVTVIPATIASIQSFFGPVAVPDFKNVQEGLTFWQSILGGFNAIGSLIGAHPWIAGTILVGGLCVMVGHKIKAARIAKHQAGVPLSAEVAKLAGA